MPIKREDWNFDGPASAGEQSFPDLPAVVERPAGYDGPMTLEETDAFAAQSGIDNVGPDNIDPDWNGETQALVLAEPALPSALLAQWQSDPAGSGFRHQQAANAVGIFDELDASDQGAVLSGFGGLPEAAQTVILGELSLGSPGTVRSADEATVDDLTQTDEGEILAAHWRGRTARNWGIVRTRYNRIIGLMSADDQQAARAWFDALPSRAKIAALIALAE